jgi:hypothetical protein
MTVLEVLNNLYTDGVLACASEALLLELAQQGSYFNTY